MSDSINRILYNLKKQVLGFGRKAYAQEGEDLILARLLEGQTQGFYVDIGAHHPQRFSNTYFFYKKGWKGINLDAMPGSMEPFKKERPRDINLEIAISDNPTPLTYYAFAEPALNTLDKAMYEQHKDAGNEPLFTRELQTQTLAQVLDNHLPNSQSISFMSVDVEGLDLQVLKSNNWQKYRPKFVLAEVLSKTIPELPMDEVYQFMESQQYVLVAKSVNTCFFKDKQA